MSAVAFRAPQTADVAPRGLTSVSSDPAHDLDDEYMRPAEAAAWLKVTPKTLGRWAEKGRIRCIVTLGGHRRFARADIEAVARQMVRAGSVES